jgi:hypothetical protein
MLMVRNMDWRKWDLKKMLRNNNIGKVERRLLLQKLNALMQNYIRGPIHDDSNVEREHE